MALSHPSREPSPIETGVLSPSLVEIRDLSIRAGIPDDLRYSLSQCPVARFAQPNGLLGGTSISDVETKPDEAGE